MKGCRKILRVDVSAGERAVPGKAEAPLGWVTSQVALNQRSFGETSVCHVRVPVGVAVAGVGAGGVVAAAR